MEINAQMVKALRDKTGVGMMDCKNALVECNGDAELAIELLRKKGADMADSKAARAATEGVIVSSVTEDGGIGALVEVNCETDFVGRGDMFREFAIPLGQLALSVGQDSNDVDSFLSLQFPGKDSTVEEVRRDLISKIGENIAVRRVSIVSALAGSVVNSYDHRGKIGVLVEISGNKADMGKDIAMHIAAMRPSWVSFDDIPESEIAKEREIYTEQAQATGKPDHIIERIVEGRLQKYAAEVTLDGQTYVKDDSLTVGKLLKQSDASVSRFVRMQLGEEIQ